jgi:type IV pilus assembly protein PilY1
MKVSQTTTSRILTFLLTLGLCLAGGQGSMAATTPAAPAAPAPQPHTTDLSTTPPDVTVTVAPNIAVTFDDSGSMGSTNLPDTLDGKYTNQYYYSANTNSQYYNPSIVYTPPLKSDGVTRFPNACYSGSASNCSSGSGAWRDGICANTTGVVVNSSGSLSTTSCTSIVDLSKKFTTSFANATSSGIQAYQAGANNIPTNTTCNGVNGCKSLMSQDGGFYYTCPTVLSNSNCVLHLMSADTDAGRQNFANWYSYYRTRNLMTRSAISNVFATLGGTIRVVFQNLNNSNYVLKGGTTKFDAFVDSSPGTGPRTNFYNWLYAVSASGGTPTRVAIDKAGKVFMFGGAVTTTTTTNGKKTTTTTPVVTNDTNPYWEPNIGPASAGMELTCRLNYSLLVTDGYWNGGDPGVKTPTVQNSITLPDGRAFTNGDANARIFWNVPSTTYSTLSDIAFYYWATNLRPDFLNAALTGPKLDVAPSYTDFTDNNGTSVAWNGTDAVPGQIYFNPANDSASWPHLVQYMITLGINGSLTYPGDLAALRNGGKAWPTPFGSGNGDLTDIDDTWHAAVNSRGQYFSARDPQALSTALTQLLNRIISRTASSVAGALSTAVLGNGAVTYTTGYNSATWSGSLLAQSVDALGNIGATLWSAGDLLSTRAGAGDSRIILTSTGTGANKGAAFRWTAAQAALTAIDPTFDTGSTGSDRLAYLRGTRTKEGTDFRSRSSILGAIINSQAVYVAYPASGYRDSFPASPSGTAAPEMAVDGTGKLANSYEQFVADHLKRAPTLYVGANDGMLHAFDATTSATDPTTIDVPKLPGAERWAYVPYSVYKSLNALTPKANFSFVPTVDGTPVTRDVFFSSGTPGWHTILVAGLRYGGRGVYALDITDASASESAPSSKVLWEFNNTSTDSGGAVIGANLGYTFGKPNIGRLADGKWVVLVPGGYFPTGSTDPAAALTNIQSSLFVLDAQTGALLRELKTPTSAPGVTGQVVSFGLTSPVIGDYDNDQIDDVAFAGDLEGNMWRFDLKAEDPADWTTTLLYSPTTPGVQPITVMPRLFADPTSSFFMVVFGTGKYLGSTDNTIPNNPPVQAVYGIRDRGPGSNSPVVGTGSLVQQTMAESDNIRGLTTLPVPAVDSTGKITINGWFFNLFLGTAGAQTNQGERVVVDPTALFDSGRAIITTLLPGNTDPCNPQRNGAVMVIDAATGGAASGVSVGSASLPLGFSQTGARVSNVPAGGSLPAATVLGGGKVVLPGISMLADGSTFSVGDAIWRRRSWRILNNGN